jgi:hypothetical protein
MLCSSMWLILEVANFSESSDGEPLTNLFIFSHTMVVALGA